MDKPIEVGCFAEIIGSSTVHDGTVVQVLFYSHDDEGMATWVIDQEFENPAGQMTDRCYEHFLRRVDGNDKELCTDWTDIEFTTGWVPDGLKETTCNQ